MALTRGDDGEHYDEYRYHHEQTGEVVTKRVKLPKDWAEQDMKWWNNVIAAKKKKEAESKRTEQQLKAMREKYGKK